MEKINLMINGLPGNVAKTIARAALKDERFNPVKFSLTGQEIGEESIVIDGFEFILVKPNARKQIPDKIRAEYGDFITIDYTHPSAVNPNARFYVENSLPFVMGTTGGDRDELEKLVKDGSIPAVVAPNMAKQIVGFQAMMEYAADTFPGLFKDYHLEVTESHQQGKADTSGTAKAVVACFNRLGTEFDLNEIKMIRDPEIQEKQLGIPKEHLSGHGWHTYTLKSPDNSVVFEFRHNINGRDIYVQGTFDAVMILHRKINTRDTSQKFFTMIDVLTNG